MCFPHRVSQCCNKIHFDMLAPNWSVLLVIPQFNPNIPLLTLLHLIVNISYSVKDLSASPACLSVSSELSLK